MRVTAFIGMATLLAVSACTRSPAPPPPATNAAFAVPDASGRFPARLVEARSGIVDGRVAFIAGREEGVGVRAYAGLMPGASVIAQPAGGANYDAQFEGAIISDITIANNFLQADNDPFSGNIRLRAEFGLGTLRGDGDGLRVRGTIDGTTLGGTVTFRNVDGELSGRVGADRVIGAFVGTSDTAIYAGGLVGEVLP